MIGIYKGSSYQQHKTVEPPKQNDRAAKLGTSEMEEDVNHISHFAIRRYIFFLLNTNPSQFSQFALRAIDILGNNS